MGSWKRAWNAIRGGQITAVNDAGPVQTAQVTLSYLETFGDRPVIQIFGLASNPPFGADAVLLAPNGDPSSGIVIGTNHQGSRPAGQAAGEATVYNGFGMTIHLSQNGIMIQANGKPMLVTGDLHVTGEVIRGYGGADQVALGSHKHPTAGVGAPSPPIPGT